MRYNPAKIEKKWQAQWQKNTMYEPDLASARNPYYNLMMFPYPSAEGLHIGSVRTFTGVDIFGRFQRLRGHDVFEPMGLDGFGIHSENYAIKIGEHPVKLAKITEKNFYRQLRSIGNGFAWREKLETYNPEYYRWTQWIFIQMFKHGLAYRKKAKVNWCPSCMTVLADEQVIKKSKIKNQKSKLQGKIKNNPVEEIINVCERCESEVIKKDLEQWFFKITDYAERLLHNIQKLDWSEKVKIAQRNWIGRSEGTEIEFRIQNLESTIKVFTTRADTLWGATFIVLAPEHELISKIKNKISNVREVEEYVRRSIKKSEIERATENKEKTGVELKGIKAINPLNKLELPIWVADYALMNVGTGALFGDAHDERDVLFAEKYSIPLKPTIKPVHGKDEAKIRSLELCFTGDGILYDSGQFSGMRSEEARGAITRWLEAHASGRGVVVYHLRDWLISRQRYWGPPIPMIHCDLCGWNPVPEKDLPVRLPFVKNFRPTGTGQSPLASVKSFYETKCPVCKKKARRETDVSDTFLDSAWYYLGYLILKNKKLKRENKKFEFDKKRIQKWLPVNMYIGGAEHSVLHLLYSRFLAMAFRDWGLTHFEEPFTIFRAHGLIIKEGAKMSKSKGNVVNPDQYLKAYGADAMRMYLAFLAPFTENGDFRDAGIAGITRFLSRVWKFYVSPTKFIGISSSIGRMVHRTIKKVGEDMEALRYNTAIAALMELFNDFEKNAAHISKENKKAFLQMLAPMAPFITEELWSTMKIKGSIHQSRWPEFDEKMLEDEIFELVIQVNGKMRAKLPLRRGASEVDAKTVSEKDPRVSKYFAGKPKKVIFVPDRLINFVF